LIERWHTIREAQFAWMKASSPSVPSIRFLVKFSDRFEQAWAGRQSLERMAGLSTRDREIEMRIRKGTDRSTAEREVDERLGLLKAKQDAEAAANQLKRQQAAFENAKADHTAAAERNATWRKVRQTQPTATDGTFEQWE
jgi:DNA replication protein DnaD